MISLRKTITYQDRLWTNTQGTGQLLKRGPIFAQRSTPAMTGHAFVRETCLLAANISAIIGEPSSEQKRYTDYAEGTLANFTKEFLNTSAGIYAAPGAETEEMPFIRYHSLWGNDHLPRQALNVRRKGALLKARGRFRRAGADAVWPSSAPLHGNGASGRRAAR